MPTVIELLRHLRGAAPPPQPPDERPAPERIGEPDGAEVEFAAYAEDCRIFGFLRLDAERLSDALNEHERVDLTDVLVVALDDGHGREEQALTVERDELLAVRAAGPRGNPARRGRTRPHPVTLQTGPYTIHGHFHALPGADPMKLLRLRKPMVPLTEAWIEYVAAGQTHRARVGTIIVNRHLVDWIRPSRDDEVGLPDLPAETAPDPHAKDLTGYIYAGSLAAPRGPERGAS